MKTKMQLATQMSGCWGARQGGDISGDLHGGHLGTGEGTMSLSGFLTPE